MSATPMIEYFDRTLQEIAPYMAATVPKARARFGSDWEAVFEDTLKHLFADDREALETAIRGYVRFALDATKLQKYFEKERCYRPKTYADAAQEVYHNRDYMHGLYLPGILLSHYLWPHHYQQLQYFHRAFLPHMARASSQRFCDVGPGSGFYSRQTLVALPEAEGTAFDISEHAISYAQSQISRYGVADRWRIESRDVMAKRPSEEWPFLICVEVLEHLEDPLGFLRVLRAMMPAGGRGFITAAITAPNADHIYLYETCDDVARQLLEAGFEILDSREDIAYEPKQDEPVPRLGAFIVS